MGKIKRVVELLLLPVALLSAKTIDSKIVQATVYPGMALIEREAGATLSAGKNELQFGRLPAGLIDGSVQVKIADGSVFIDEIRVEKWFLEKAEEGRLKSLSQQIADIDREDKVFESTLKTLNAQEKFISSIQVSAANQASQQLALGKSDPAGWSATLSFMDSQLTRLFQSMIETEGKRTELAAKREALQKQLDKARSAKPKEEKSVVVMVNGKAEQTITLRLSYMIGPANWEPVYDLRTAPLNGQVQLVGFAEISQKTGEDWSQAALVLSTSSPSRGAELPQLRPWRLAFIQPMPAARYRETSVMGVAQAPVMEEKLQDQEAVVQPVKVEEKSLSVLFEIPEHHEILSGEDPVRIPTFRHDWKGKMLFSSVPKLEQMAYMQTMFANESNHPILAGKAKIFVDGDFTGSIMLPNIAPAESATVSLGGDDRIKVKREMVRRLERNTGTVSKKSEVEYEYSTEVTNYHDKPVQLKIFDQLPVPAHDEIEIIDIKLIPETQIGKESGQVTWDVSLAPKEKKQIRMQFAVRYPRNSIIPGL